jgi:hypothetical protein
VIVIIFPNNYNLQLNYLILYDPILRLLLESYSYHVYMQYDMIWHTNAGRLQKCRSILPDAYENSNLVSNQFWSRNITVQIYFKNSFIFGLGSYFWRKKSKSQETVLEYFGKAGAVRLLHLRWGPRSRQPSHLVYIWLSARQCIFENL